MILGALNSEEIWHQQLVYLPPHLYAAATLSWEIRKSHFFNSIIHIIHTYCRLFTLSHKKTNCYSLTHHTWKMLLHYLVKCTKFFIFFHFVMRIKYQSAIWTSCGSVLLRHSWISAERGARCSWSVAKKTGNMYPCRRWSLWTFAVTLLAWHFNCHTSQPVLLRPINANPLPAFIRATNVWRNATYLQSDEKVVHLTK